MTTIVSIATAEDLWRLPDDGNLHELVKGELRTMAPAGFEHGNIGSNLLGLLWQVVRQRSLGHVVGPDTGFVIGRSPDTVRCPDVAFIRAERIEGALVRGFFPGAPDLAVEVVSPSDTFEAVDEKVNDWLGAGTKLVWVVSPRQRTVTVYRPGTQVSILRAGDRLSGEDVVPGFECGVGEIFR